MTFPSGPPMSPVLRDWRGHSPPGGHVLLPGLRPRWRAISDLGRLYSTQELPRLFPAAMQGVGQRVRERAFVPGKEG